MKAMKKEYGKKKGEEVFYASANKGKIKNVHEELKKEDIEKFATEEEKEFLKEKDYKKILKRGMRRKARQFKLGDIYMNSKTDEDFSQKVKGKYTPSEIKKFMTQEDIDQYATEDEKEFLKENNISGHNYEGFPSKPAYFSTLTDMVREDPENAHIVLHRVWLDGFKEGMQNKENEIKYGAVIPKYEIGNIPLSNKELTDWDSIHDIKKGKEKWKKEQEGFVKKGMIKKNGIWGYPKKD